jgi:sugar/nucleoside kinase (ribokinase family)
LTRPTPEVIVAGHICLDVIPAIEAKKNGLDAFLVPGKLIDVGPARTSTGGTVPNTGLALHRMEFRTRLVGKIGRDLFGEAIAAAIRQYGDDLADDMIVADDVPTSYTLVINPPNVDRIFLHCPGANDTFTVDDLQPSLLDGARLFHFGYPPLMRRMFEADGAELARLLAFAKNRGLTVSLDMARPDPDSPAGRADWRQILARSIPFVDIFMPSFEEILFMLRPDTYWELARKRGTEDLLSCATGALLSSLSEELLAMGAAVIAFKLGSHGLYLRTTDDPGRLNSMGPCAPSPEQSDNWLGRELIAPCFRVKEAGTTGAGDATIAGFLASLLKGLPVESALLGAVGVGAFSVEHPDAGSGIPTWEALIGRITAGWPQHEVRLDLDGWQYDALARVWYNGKGGK